MNNTTELYLRILYKSLIITKICNSNTKAIDKVLITPIVSKGPSYYIIINLIDFRSNINGNSAYIRYIRDAFLYKSWLNNLLNKEALIITSIFEKWLRANRRGSIY